MGTAIAFVGLTEMFPLSVNCLVYAASLSLILWGGWRWETSITWAYKKKVISSIVLVGIYSALMAFPIIKQYQKERGETVTRENVENYIHSWLDAFGQNVQDDPSEGAYFHLVVIKPSGNRISIGRWKEHGKYITLRARIQPSEYARGVLNKLPGDQAQEIREELVGELTRAQIVWRAETPLPSGTVDLEKRVPISGLTEDVFIRQMDELESAVVAFENTIASKR